MGGLGFEGCWRDRGEIRGKTLFWKDGPEVALELAGRDIELCLDGARHHGVLKEDGKLHWDDGDIWSREAGDAQSKKFAFDLFAEVHLSVEVDRLQAGTVGTVVGFSDQYVEVKFVGRICRCLAKQLKHKSSREAICQTPPSCCIRESAKQEPKLRQNPKAGLCSGSCSSAVGCATDRASAVPAKQTWAAREQTRPAAAMSGGAVERADPAPAKPAPDAKGQICTLQEFGSSAAEKLTALRVMDRTVPVANKAADASTKWFHGVVTWSRGSLGWVDCRELREDFPERNTFLHRSEWNGSTMPRKHDRIMFRLEVGSDGNPKAVQAKPEVSETEAPQRLTLAEYRQSLPQHSRNGRPV